MYTNLLNILLGIILDMTAINFIVNPGIIKNLFFSIKCNWHGIELRVLYYYVI